MIVERVRHSGMLVVSELVTADGETWLETHRYLDYTEEEAREHFAEYLVEKGYEVAD